MASRCAARALLAAIATAIMRGIDDRFGSIRLKIARTRGRSFLPPGWTRSASFAGSGDADSCGLSAWHRHPPIGPCGGHADQRRRQRARRSPT